MGQLDTLTARHKSGHTLQVRIYLNVIPNRTGQALNVLAGLTPAPEHSPIMEQVEREAGVGTWEWDLQSDRLSWSRGVYTMFGMDPTEVTVSYAAYLEHVHPR